MMLGALSSALPLQRARARERGPSLRRILEQGRLRILLSLGVPPFGYRSPTGGLAGFDVAIGRLLAEGLGVQPSFQDASLSEAMDRLGADEADLICHVPLIMAHAQEVLLTSPVGRVDIVLAAPAGLGLRRLSDVAGRTIGLLEPGALESVAREALPEASRLLAFPRLSALAAALTRGEVDAVLLRRPVAMLLQRTDPQLQMVQRFLVTNHWISVGLPFGEHDLLRAVNSLIFLARSRGELSAFSETLLGTPLPELPTF